VRNRTNHSNYSRADYQFDHAKAVLLRSEQHGNDDTDEDDQKEQFNRRQPPELHLPFIIGFTANSHTLTITDLKIRPTLEFCSHAAGPFVKFNIPKRIAPAH
jgi:hypothetical protein